MRIKQIERGTFLLLSDVEICLCFNVNLGEKFNRNFFSNFFANHSFRLFEEL